MYVADALRILGVTCSGRPDTPEMMAPDVKPMNTAKTMMLPATEMASIQTKD